METINSRYIMLWVGGVGLAERWLYMLLQVISQRWIAKLRRKDSKERASERGYLGLVCINSIARSRLCTWSQQAAMEEVGQELGPVHSGWGSERSSKSTSSKARPLFTPYFHQTCLPPTKTMNHPPPTQPPSLKRFSVVWVIGWSALWLRSEGPRGV